MDSLYIFPSHNGTVLVPIDAVRKDPALGWCLAWRYTLTTRAVGGELISVLCVPAAEWEQHWLTPGPDEERSPTSP